MAVETVYHALINTWDRMDNRLELVEVKGTDTMDALYNLVTRGNSDWTAPQEGEFQVMVSQMEHDVHGNLTYPPVLVWAPDGEHGPAYYISTSKLAVCLIYVRDRIAMQS